MNKLFSLFSNFSGSPHKTHSIRGNGKITIQERKILPFATVKVSGAISLNLTLGSEAIEAFVIADENVLPLILTEIVGDVLHIYSQDSFTMKSQPSVNLAAPEVLNVVSSGSSDVMVHGINQAEISLSTSGSGDITASGNTRSAKLRVSGSGSIRCVSLDADNLDAKISGSGSVSATAKSSASLKVSGSGKIQVWGSPKLVQSDRSGSGSIHLR
ncbi:DUF2807 domain-containing protein [Rhizobium sp. MHM7A]|uniref:GIN domain-containing protein n=1 Tax=Rhizobium sp. MHM7A TaxID=2583233 RepID=UPI0011059BB6|nr:DUF2807 domain-containing protein [Rhizobium sp. MHM7A]TLX15804.1 DUF2807 domain-containing protein [Rhizobium sp. MHM7A]